MSELKEPEMLADLEHAIKSALFHEGVVGLYGQAEPPMVSAPWCGAGSEHLECGSRALAAVRGADLLTHYRTAKKEEWAGGYQSCREDHGITEEDDQP